MAFVCKEFPGRRFSSSGELRKLRALQLLLTTAIAARRVRVADAVVVAVEKVDGKEKEEQTSES